MAVKPVTLAVGLAAVLTLSACVHGVDIDFVTANRQLIFDLSDAGFFKAGRVCLTEIEVSDTTHETPNIMWRAHAGEQKCLPLKRLEYGNLPQGFAEDSPPLSLAEGRIYTIDVSGYGWMGRERFAKVGSAYRQQN